MSCIFDPRVPRWSAPPTETPSNQNKRRRLNRMDPRIREAHLARVGEPIFCPRDIPMITPINPSNQNLPHPLGTADPYSWSRSGHIAALESREQEDSFGSNPRHRSESPSAPNSPFVNYEEPDWTRSPDTILSDQFQIGRQSSLHDLASNYTFSHPFGTLERVPAVTNHGHLTNSSSPVPRHVQVYRPGHDTTETSHLHQTSMIQSIVDEDALDVDDPKRSYDFIEFMAAWYCYSVTDSSGVLPHTNKPWLSERPEYVTPTRMQEECVDMQGLQWRKLNIERDDALRTRWQLHPSRLHEEVLRFPGPLRCKGSQLYHFRSSNPIHKAHPSHYQLRNVLTSIGRSHIFYATQHQVMRTALACPDTKQIAIGLAAPDRTVPPVRITCLSNSQNWGMESDTNNNVLFAGGFSGEYTMLDLTTQTSSRPIEGFVTHAYNGIVNHIATSPNRRSGLLEATFSSNDQRVRTLDVKTQKFTSSTCYEYAMNCSAISPDGRLRVLVGDSNETLICNADNGEPLVTLNGHTDHAFACAWSPNDNIVATGAQDGRVILWDARNWSQPLRTIDAAMSCARSLHFTDDGMLVVAESEDVVSIYHPREEEMRQDIRFFGSIAGLSLLDGGAEIVVANADRTVGGLMRFRRKERYDSRSMMYEPQSNSIFGKEVFV